MSQERICPNCYRNTECDRDKEDHRKALRCMVYEPSQWNDAELAGFAAMFARPVPKQQPGEFINRIDITNSDGVTSGQVDKMFEGQR